jgi:hypothetical protein
MMPFAAMRLKKPASAAVAERIYMDFEGANGSQVFTDIGTGASTWTWAGSAALTTSTVLAGTSSLSIPTTSSYIETPYTTGNRIPPTGNWSLTFKARASSAGGWVQAGVGTYLLSVQNSTATAAGTAFAMATNASGKMQLVLSDGTTRSLILTGATTLATNTAWRIGQPTAGNNPPAPGFFDTFRLL